MRKAIAILMLVAVTLCSRAMAQDSTLFPRGEIGKNTSN